MSEMVSPRPRWRRRLARFGVFFAVCLLAVLVMLSIFENRLIYFPSGPESWVESAELDKEDVTLTSGDGVAIHAWWCPREGTNSALLYCHGNGGNLSMRGREYRQLRDKLGVPVLAIDYPGYGRSRGRPTEQGCYDSALAALDWLDGRGVPPERVILFGESLGGGVVTQVATRRPCRALVLYSTFTSLPDVAHDIFPLLPARWLMRNRFDNRGKLPGINRPVFICHGDADGLIAVEHAPKLLGLAVGPKAMHIDAGRQHALDLTPEFLTALREFLENYAP